MARRQVARAGRPAAERGAGAVDDAGDLVEWGRRERHRLRLRRRPSSREPGGRCTDLPLIDDRVTVEHLLAHRSGIGDYVDEDEAGDITDYAMPIPVHLLADTEEYVAVLDGHPQVSLPGERFAYNADRGVQLERRRLAAVHACSTTRVCDAGSHRLTFAVASGTLGACRRSVT